MFAVRSGCTRADAHMANRGELLQVRAGRGIQRQQINRNSLSFAFVVDLRLRLLLSLASASICELDKQLTSIADSQLLNAGKQRRCIERFATGEVMK